MSKQSELDNNCLGRRELSTTDHPEFGRTITFVDSKGLGMEIGTGEDAFIVRSAGAGKVVVEAKTEAAEIKAKELISKIYDRRGGFSR